MKITTFDFFSTNLKIKNLYIILYRKKKNVMFLEKGARELV